jgi:hypothetical protein
MQCAPVGGGNERYESESFKGRVKRSGKLYSGAECKQFPNAFFAIFISNWTDIFMIQSIADRRN